MPSLKEVLAAALLFSLRLHAQTEPDAPIPDGQRALFARLQERVETFDRQIGPPDPNAAVLFSAELSTATGQRGLVLLRPATRVGIDLELKRMQGLGLHAVTVAVSFPILSREFYDFNGDPQDYDAMLRFYRDLALNVHGRGMKLIVKAGMLFPGIYSAGSGLKIQEFYQHAGADFARYKAEAVAATIREMHPEFLTLGSEPDIEARLGSGASGPEAFGANIALYSKQAKAAAVTGTRIGAGVGTWQKNAREYIAQIAPHVDFIDLHIYPVNFNLLASAITLADYARSLGKPAAISEAWLMKEDDSELSRVNSVTDPRIFARDSFRFWAPLDQRFLAALAHLARAKDMLFLSPFWTRYFWSYLDYEDVRAAEAPDVLKKANGAAAAALVKGQVSSTGRAYALIAKGVSGK